MTWVKGISTTNGNALKYHNGAKFSDRQVLANSVDPDQTALRVYTVCNSIYSFWNNYSMDRPPCWTFREITAKILGVRILWIFKMFRQTGLCKQCRPKWDSSKSSLIRAFTVCHSVCIYRTHYCMVKLHRPDFGRITGMFSCVQIFQILTVIIRD